jgi:hypothetical protein
MAVNHRFLLATAFLGSLLGDSDASAFLSRTSSYRVPRIASAPMFAHLTPLFATRYQPTTEERPDLPPAQHVPLNRLMRGDFDQQHWPFPQRYEHGETLVGSNAIFFQDAKNLDAFLKEARQPRTQNHLHFNKAWLTLPIAYSLFAIYVIKNSKGFIPTASVTALGFLGLAAYHEALIKLINKERTNETALDLKIQEQMKSMIIEYRKRIRELDKIIASLTREKEALENSLTEQTEITEQQEQHLAQLDRLLHSLHAERQHNLDILGKKQQELIAQREANARLRSENQQLVSEREGVLKEKEAAAQEKAHAEQLQKQIEEDALELERILQEVRAKTLDPKELDPTSLQGLFAEYVQSLEQNNPAALEHVVPLQARFQARPHAVGSTIAYTLERYARPILEAQADAQQEATRAYRAEQQRVMDELARSRANFLSQQMFQERKH